MFSVLLALRIVLDPILVKLVEQFKIEHPSEYAFRVMLWERLREEGIVIPGFTTEVKCASYPFGMVVVTTSVSKKHVDKVDTKSLGVDLTIGRCNCHSGGLELSGVNDSMGVCNATEAMTIDFRSYLHTYQTLDEKQSKLVCERCNGGSCTTNGVPTYDEHSPPNEQSKQCARFALLLTGHGEDNAYDPERGYKTWIDRPSKRKELKKQYVVPDEVLCARRGI